MARQPTFKEQVAQLDGETSTIMRKFIELGVPPPAITGEIPGALLSHNLVVQNERDMGLAELLIEKGIITEEEHIIKMKERVVNKLQELYDEVAPQIRRARLGIIDGKDDPLH